MKTLPKRTEGPRLLTLQQASQYTGVPYASLWDLVTKGHLSRVQLGDSRRIWVRKADLERIVADESVA